MSFAHKLKNRIIKDLGFKVNIGIYVNKYLAKMASDFEKPDKVHTLFPTEIKTKMLPLPAHKLKNRISKELGFTVNIGISGNKYLAKMASHFEKPDKVHTLFPTEIKTKMCALPVTDLLFVGRDSPNVLK